MKQYQSWLGQYLMSRRDGDHAMASELASSICEFWQAQGDEAESSASGSRSTSSTWKRPPDPLACPPQAFRPITHKKTGAHGAGFAFSDDPDYIWSTISWANWEQERRVAPSIRRSKS